MDVGDGPRKSPFLQQSSCTGQSTSFLHISPDNLAMLLGCSSSSPGLTTKGTWTSLSSLQSAVQRCSIQSSFPWEEKELLPMNHHKKDA